MGTPPSGRTSHKRVSSHFSDRLGLGVDEKDDKKMGISPSSSLTTTINIYVLSDLRRLFHILMFSRSMLTASSSVVT